MQFPAAETDSFGSFLPAAAISDAAAISHLSDKNPGVHSHESDNELHDKHAIAESDLDGMDAAAVPQHEAGRQQAAMDTDQMDSLYNGIKSDYTLPAVLCRPGECQPMHGYYQMGQHWDVCVELWVSV